MSYDQDNAIRDASTMEELCAAMSGQPGSPNYSVGKHLAEIAAVGGHNEVEFMELLREKARDGLASMLGQGLPLDQISAAIVNEVALAITGRSMLRARGAGQAGSA
ncbi:hypothetical protein GLI01_23480 [Gluconacetobacter liquefaciens]|uniref:Uncharacterized protein n=1 Tax=Gluconacetobacter liquefaciens TaxID=89584 RepID=A0A370G6L6_GLULI|nr:hypothetical protein [Gluconacetobacter liquefaciens]MBB2186487.1 hypothetical protein [Gluconacetobacter liquefaciens]RDI38154.1 hypothetical protein C7453_10491 [Gluconacetobacter liquefaciens]GBQ98120.1 hypothetical protein AA0522_1046 [Gluconacetobacter liquefaciens NRIC 0522]GEB38313.1 hypothetical protein GLI01_23480 [Gluconacetobacter liquefaciens]